MKKLLSLLLTSILMFSCLSFVGCFRTDISIEEELLLDVIVEHYNQDGDYVTDRFTISSKEEYVYELHTSSRCRIVSRDIPYFKDGMITGLSRSDIEKEFEFGYDQAKYVTEFNLEEIWKTGHKFSLKLKVWDEKPKYVVEYDVGSNNISSNNNKFVYKYDGGLHLPSLKLSYNNKEICTVTSLKLYNISEIKKFNGTEFVARESGSLASDVGLYQYTFVLEEILPDEYKDFFSLIMTTITIEIVE